MKRDAKDGEALLNAADVAARVNLPHPEQAYAVMRLMPTVRIGRRVRVRPEALEAFLANNESNPSSPTWTPTKGKRLAPAPAVLAAESGAIRKTTPRTKPRDPEGRS